METAIPVRATPQPQKTKHVAKPLRISGQLKNIYCGMAAEAKGAKCAASSVADSKHYAADPYPNPSFL